MAIQAQEKFYKVLQAEDLLAQRKAALEPDLQAASGGAGKAGLQREAIQLEVRQAFVALDEARARVALQRRSLEQSRLAQKIAA